MRVTDDELRALLNDSMAEAGDILHDLVKPDKNLMQALLALMTATAVMARSMDLPLEHLLEGLEAAYSSLEEGSHHAVQ